MHRFDSNDGGDAVLTGDVIITPSSWRAGKELADRILQGKWKPEEHLDPLDHSASSSLHDSLDYDSSRSYASRSNSGSLPEKEPSHAGAPPASAREPEEGGGLESELGGSSHSSILESHPRAAQLSSDMNQLLEELRASSREVGPVDVEGAREKREGPRERDASGRNVVKKPKYNFGKSQSLSNSKNLVCT